MNENIKHIKFTSRTIPIPADYRPLYKIGHILLILHLSSRGGKASLMKLHFLSWAIKSRKNIGTVKEWIKRDFKNDFHIWGIEPTVNRALSFAKADNFLKEEGGSFELTERGIVLVKSIMKDKEVFVEEKVFLLDIGKTEITENKINQLSKQLLINYA